MTDRLEEFRTFRERMNARILEAGNLKIRRFFALDTRAYDDGALPTRTKELLGLVASLVLRCDDCVTYHLGGGMTEPSSGRVGCRTDRRTWPLIPTGGDAIQN